MPRLLKEVATEEFVGARRPTTLKARSIVALKALLDGQVKKYHGNVFLVRPQDDHDHQQYQPGWYHTDETQADAYGPFATFKEAEAQLLAYCEWLDQREPEADEIHR